MRIGFVVSLTYGLDQFVYRELAELEKRGHQIAVFSIRKGRGLYTPKPGWNLFEYSGLSLFVRLLNFIVTHPVKFIKIFPEALRYKVLADLIIAFQFQQEMTGVNLIHAIFGDHKFFVAYFCKRLTGKPLFVTIHAYELYNNPRPALFRHALKFADRIITVTEVNRELLIERFGVPEERVFVMRIIVDDAFFQISEKFKILIVAFFAEKKGHEILFEAIRMLQNPALEVWVAGEELAGTRHPLRLPEKVKELGISDQVIFWGPVKGNTLKALYRECDLFCLPSRTAISGDSEGFPTVLAEALAAGKPILTTDHVEIPRVISEYVVPENDAAKLAAAIDRLYRQPQLLRDISSGNRELAKKMFSRENLDQYEDFLRALK